jgi:hypothetical protein
MSKLTKFNDIAVANTENVKGGFFSKPSCGTSYQSYCAPKPTYCAPVQPTYCAPKTTYCAPVLPKISFSFSWGKCW